MTGSGLDGAAPRSPAPMLRLSSGRSRPFETLEDLALEERVLLRVLLEPGGAPRLDAADDVVAGGHHGGEAGALGQGDVKARQAEVRFSNPKLKKSSSSHGTTVFAWSVCSVV